jgi:hypothetical protein
MMTFLFFLLIAGIFAHVRVLFSFLFVGGVGGKDAGKQAVDPLLACLLQLTVSKPS